MTTVPDWWFVRGRCITVELTMNDMFLAFMGHKNKQIFDLVSKLYFTIEMKKIIVTLVYINCLKSWSNKIQDNMNLSDL